LSKRLSPSLLAVPYNDSGIALEESRDFRELTDVLPLDTKPDTSATEEDEHSLIKGLRVIYG
jgi:hypothetical protein